MRNAIPGERLALLAVTLLIPVLCTGCASGHIALAYGLNPGFGANQSDAAILASATAPQPGIPVERHARLAPRTSRQNATIYTNIALDDVKPLGEQVTFTPVDDGPNH